VQVTKTEYLTIHVKASEIVEYLREQGFVPEEYKVTYIGGPEYGYGATDPTDYSFVLNLQKKTELGGKK
jgi:hypothetical protein